MLGSVKHSEAVKCLGLSFSPLVFRGVLVPEWQQSLPRSLRASSGDKDSPIHPSIPLPSLLSSLASLLFPQNHFSCMLALCSPYIAKSELLSPPAYPFCLLSQPSVNHTCSLDGQSYSGWHFWELLSLLMFLKFLSLLFLAQKSSSYYFNSTWQISVPSFHKADISSLEKGWFLFHPIHQLLF